MDWRFEQDEKVIENRRTIVNNMNPSGRYRWLLYVVGAAAILGGVIVNILRRSLVAFKEHVSGTRQNPTHSDLSA